MRPRYFLPSISAKQSSVTTGIKSVCLLDIGSDADLDKSNASFLTLIERIVQKIAFSKTPDLT